MTDNITHIDVDSDEFEDAPKALRDYVKKLQRQNKGLTDELDGVRKERAAKAVADVLADKGFKNPKRVENDLLADKIDPLDKGAVEAWLADNADDYARVQGSSEAEQSSAETTQEQQALEQMNNLNVQAAPSADSLASAQAEITPEMTSEQVRAVFLKHGL